MARIVEIQVVLHTDAGDVTTTYRMNPNENAWSIKNAKELHSAMENFKAYVNDGYKASMNTVTYD